MTRSRRTKMSRSSNRDKDDDEKKEDEALEAHDEL